MKSSWLIAALVLVITGGLLIWKVVTEPVPGPVELSGSEGFPVVTESSEALDEKHAGVSVEAEAQEQVTEKPRTLSDPVESPPEIRANPDAVASLRRGREQGEPRTPPLVEESPEREMPTEEELADSDMYLEYEARQKQDVLASFLQASEKKASELRDAIERAEAQGLPPEQLAEGREKLKRLEAMREEVLRDHPELSAPEEEEDGQPSPTSP